MIAQQVIDSIQAAFKWDSLNAISLKQIQRYGQIDLYNNASFNGIIYPLSWSNDPYQVHVTVNEVDWGFFKRALGLTAVNEDLLESTYQSPDSKVVISVESKSLTVYLFDGVNERDLIARARSSTPMEKLQFYHLKGKKQLR